MCSKHGHTEKILNVFILQQVIGKLNSVTENSLCLWGHTKFIKITHHALSGVLAWILHAFADDPRLTVSPGETNRTGARVIISSVETGCSVMTRSMVGAEVQILVAEETAPAGLALARVAGTACTVYTTRVPLALCTAWSLPAVLTSENKKRLLNLVSKGIQRNNGS